MTTRRNFVKATTAAVMASTLPRLLRAAAPARLDAVGIQLYTLRSEMTKDVEATLARVAAIGYRQVEFAGYFKREPAALRATLDSLKLTAPAAHVGLEALESDWDSAAAAAKTIGHRWLIVPSLGRAQLASVDAIKATAARLNALGRKAKDAGLRVGFHNHNAEFRVTDGVVPLDLLGAELDPALVDLEMDLYWTINAGADPLAYFKKFAGRIRLVHVKDSGGAPQHEMREVGAGVIDWKSLFAQRKLAGIEHFIVEHDQPKDAFASAAASYDYLSKLNF
jgi:sugar phosphate isomerase/epimerase